MPRIIPPSEFIINSDGSVFHLHLLPEQLTDRIILVGDPARVNMVAEFFDTEHSRFLPVNSTPSVAPTVENP